MKTKKWLICDICNKNHSKNKPYNYEILQRFQWSVMGLKTDNRLGIYVKCVNNCNRKDIRQ